MNKIASRIAAAALAAAMAVSFTSCGKKNKDVIASKENIFSTESIPMPEGLTYINTIRYSDGKLFIIGTHNWTTKAENKDGSDNAAVDTGTANVMVVNARVMAETEVSTVSSDDTPAETDAPADEDTPEDAAPTDPNEDTPEDAAPADEEPIAVMEEVYHNETKLMIVNMDGSVENDIVLIPDGESSGGSWRNVDGMEIISDGSIIISEQTSRWDEAAMQSEEKYKFIKFDSSGNKLGETDLEKVKETAMKAANQDYFYINSFMVTDDGKYILTYDSTLYFCDESGNVLNSLKYEASSYDNVWLSGLYKTGDGRIITYVSMGKMDGDEYKSENKLLEIDMAAYAFGAEYTLTAGGSFMNGTDKYDLLINRDSGLAGYDIETGNTETIIDWLKSGFDTTAMEYGSTTVMPDGRIICVTHDYQYHGGGGYGYGGNDLIISILTKVDPETLPDRKLIKLYALYLGTDVKRQILDFNKNNPEFEIELTSYSDDSGDWQDAIKRMNNDMIAGKLPDILVINGSLPIESYISKGLLANIYDFIETDAELNKEDFLPNLLKAYEVNEKLYYIVPEFSISTLVGKTSDVGDKQGWTMDEFISYVDAHPDSSVMDDRYTTSVGMLYQLVSYNYDSFVNKDTGECHFDSEDFIKILEFCTRYPKEINYDEIDQDQSYWQNYETQWRTGRTLLSGSYISRFKEIRRLEQSTFGEPVTFIGYPGSSGSGSTFESSGTLLAITSKANNSDGAWAFVRQFLTKEYQEMYANQHSYRFSVRLDILEKQMELAKERPYWEREDGEKEYYDESYWLGDQEIKIGVNTDEDNRKMMDFIRSVDQVSNYNENVQKIINEEAGSFFEGQKSANEVARIIQDRVSTLINEGK